MTPKSNKIPNTDKQCSSVPDGNTSNNKGSKNISA